MSIKLIASDLDGTLMSPDHLTVSKRTYNTLKTAHERGIKLAVATGRPLALIDNVLDQVPFVDYVIYSNGACAYDRNEKKAVHSDLVENEKAIKIVEYFLSLDVFFEIYVNGRSCYQLNKARLFNNMGLPQEFLDEVASTMDGYDSLLDFMKNDGSGMEKITFYGITGEVSENIKTKLEQYGLVACSSLPGTLEATNITADKGNALKGICKSMGITSAEVMSFGDAENDCSMLKFAEHSFAMANGTNECKASAKHITLSNADDGVAVAIEKYAL